MISFTRKKLKNKKNTKNAAKTRDIFILFFFSFFKPIYFNFYSSTKTTVWYRSTNLLPVCSKYYYFRLYNVFFLNFSTAISYNLFDWQKFLGQNKRTTRELLVDRNTAIDGEKQKVYELNKKKNQDLFRIKKFIVFT